jgi:hypothetical protein
MNRRALTLAAFVTIASFGTTEARTLASPPLYGGANEINGLVGCRLFNAGTAAVTITVHKLIANDNSVARVSDDSCGSSLGAGDHCAFDTMITGNLAYSCLVNATGTTVNLLRGSIDLLDPVSLKILNALPLQ